MDVQGFQIPGRLQKYRGSALDVFGKTEERHQERQAIEDYIRTLDEIIAKLSTANHAAAVALASVPTRSVATGM